MSQPATLAATVIVPTAIDRGPTLTLAVESVLRQTVRDMEVFIIGDGVADVTRQAAQALVAADSRVRFFDHPKHPRRGEPYRHAALQEARGRIVCYLVDRDLFFPDHVEEMCDLLREADMAHSFLLRIGSDGIQVPWCFDAANEQDRRMLATSYRGIPLPFGAHTMDAYRRLREGWSPTPKGVFTDGYFWGKFAADPAMRCVGGWRPTVMNFPRGKHPGMSTLERYAEIKPWADRLKSREDVASIRREVELLALRDRAERARLQRRSVEVDGVSLARVLWRVIDKKIRPHLPGRSYRRLFTPWQKNA